MTTHIALGLLVRRGAVLLGLRGQTPVHADFWALPGGRVEPGEHPEEALRRELREEIGLGAGLDLGLHLDWRDEGGRRFTCFIVSAWSGEPSNQEPDRCVELAWFDLRDLPTPLTPETHTFLQTFSLQDT